MKLSLDFLSQYRTELMGFAIFWIFFYHTGVNIPVFKALFSVGWIGVEIFFLVSGFGLCSSLTKNPNIIQFYKRRFIRIIPTWWFILGFMHVVGFVSGGGGKMSSFNMGMCSMVYRNWMVDWRYVF